MPKKNKQSSTASNLLSGITGRGDDDDASSISSVSTMGTVPQVASSMNTLSVKDHRRSPSSASFGRNSPRASVDGRPLTPAPDDSVVLWRENQRISLRAFLRTLLSNPQIASTRAIQDFLTFDPVTPTDADVDDIAKRKAMDAKRVEEQKQFYEIARKRAADLDVYMEQFRRDIVESNGLTKLFKEIKEKKTIQELSIQYQKFAEWLRIEVAATLYHLFLAEDNSPELFAQFKRIHSLVPYGALKQVIRFTNPAAVMTSVLDLFMAQPMGAKSLLQRIFLYAVGDGVKSLQQSIESLTARLMSEEKQGGEKNRVFCEKIRNYTYGPDEVKEKIRGEAVEEKTDLLVKLLQSEDVQPELSPDQIGRAFNAYVAWDNAVTNVNEPEMRDAAELYAQL